MCQLIIIKTERCFLALDFKPVHFSYKTVLENENFYVFELTMPPLCIISVTADQRALLTRVGEQVGESNDRLDFLDAAKKHLEAPTNTFFHQHFLEIFLKITVYGFLNLS